MVTNVLALTMGAAYGEGGMMRIYHGFHHFTCNTEREFLINTQPVKEMSGCFTGLIVHRYSREFTSVHGGRPTAEYAKLRRESLESEFGEALGTYSTKSFSAAYRFGPFLALYRAAIISFHVVKLAFWQLFVRDMRKRAVKVCVLVTIDDLLFNYIE